MNKILLIIQSSTVLNNGLKLIKPSFVSAQLNMFCYNLYFN